LSALKNLISDLKEKLKDIEEMDVEETVNKLESEKRELDHRFLLGPLFEKVKNYIEKLKWAQAAKTVGGTTHHITTKHNQLFRELVTDEYLRLFEQTLKDMGRPLKVKITTPGQKGKTLRQIVLETAVDTNARPDKVLSEGEKRAVALADFLTEIELDTTSNGMILDDPVTSLDLEWRETIAKMLVKKSKVLQVIIFTHDLPFLYYIKEYAKDEEISISTHWIKRGGDNGKPGYVYLDNSPALERDYRKATKAREIHAQALQAGAAYQEFLLRDGFGSLRTCYEAFIIFDLFNEVVMRFSERISYGRLSTIYWEPELVQDVVDSCDRLSRNLEGHLHSDALGSVKPTPADLLREIEHFESLQKRLRELKKKEDKKA
jgi:ABC-type transport system involved in cytochrome c biogenesis ATPase subunit